MAKVREIFVPEVKGGTVEVVYQSEEARAKAEESAKMVFTRQDDTPKIAESLRVVNSAKSQTEDPEELVPVVPNITIPLFNVGQRTFSVREGVKCLVPRFIAGHLKEKGVI